MRHGGGQSTDFLEILAQRVRTERGGDSPRTTTLAAIEPPTPDDGLAWLAGRPTEQERFSGHRPLRNEKPEDAWRRTLVALSQLALWMKESGRDVSGETFNPLIPAGYTYLGQLVAHDLVLTASRPLDQTDRAGENLRTGALTLESIYRGGPEAAPWLYEPGAEPDDPRTRLRLGRSFGPGNVPGGFGDLPRVSSRCPASATVGGRPTLDPLIGDQRNDDNLILSQLLVTFHKVHNRLVDLVAEPLPADPTRKERWDALRQQFETARLLTIHVFRRILVEDFLPKILKRPVLDRHVARYRRATSDREERRRIMADPEFNFDVPCEFSMAGFRLGHVMVAPSYNFSDLQGRSVGVLWRLLEATRLGNPTLLPLADDWIIDWC